MTKIDKKDLKILNLLEKNSRESLSSIAKKTRLSPQSTFYRINKLISEKTILGFPTRIDHAYMHLIEVIVYFKISYISESKLNEIINYFLKQEDVIAVRECGGNWDLAVTYLVDNLSQFNKILHQDLQEFPKQFSSYEIFFTIVTHHFGDLGGYKRSHIILGGDRPRRSFKKSDLKLLYELGQDGRISIVDLSKKIKKDPKTIIKKINNLKKENIIRDFTTEIDNSQIGLLIHKLLISYHDPTEREEKEFLNFIKKQEEITSLTKVMGKYDVIITTKIKNEIELRRLLFKLREKFSDIIDEILDIPIYQTHKRVYLPKSVLT